MLFSTVVFEANRIQSPPAEKGESPFATIVLLRTRVSTAGWRFPRTMPAREFFLTILLRTMIPEPARVIPCSKPDIKFLSMIAPLPQSSRTPHPVPAPCRVFAEITTPCGLPVTAISPVMEKPSHVSQELPAITMAGAPGGESIAAGSAARMVILCFIEPDFRTSTGP